MPQAACHPTRHSLDGVSRPPVPRRPMVRGGAVLLGVLWMAGSGCSSLALPRLMAPGSSEYQQRQAHQFDPYPDDSIGPRNDGPRPRDFIKPPPEPVRARWVEEPAQPGF